MLNTLIKVNTDKQYRFRFSIATADVLIIMTYRIKEDIKKSLKSDRRKCLEGFSKGVTQGIVKQTDQLRNHKESSVRYQVFPVGEI